MSSVSTNKHQSINNLDMISLLGLFSLSEKEKIALRSEIDRTLLTNFFNDNLDKSFSEIEKKELQEMVDGGEDFDHILDFIVTKAPNIGNLLNDYLIQSKKALVLKQYDDVLKDLEETLSVNISTENEKIKKKMNLYNQAKQMVETNKFSEAQQLLITLN